ncbi:MAG: Ig-like domain-containing protein [Desulfobacterales bacterium]|nr:Ig-like domain-containing protein [Desulfobacterales bacterium]
MRNYFYVTICILILFLISCGSGSQGGSTTTTTSSSTSTTTTTVEPTTPRVGSVTNNAGSSSIVADGESDTNITATVKDTNGTNMPDGTSVVFKTSAGDIDNTQAGSQDSFTAKTKNGIAIATLASSTQLGTATINASSGGVTGSTTVKFVAGPPYKVQLSADPSTLEANGSSTSTIKVNVFDKYDNPVSDGETVNFKVKYGNLSNLTSETKGGSVSITYTSPKYVPEGGKDEITAQATNGVYGEPNPLIITLKGTQISSITLSADPESLAADGKSQSTITATVTKAGGGNPPDGTRVNFSIVSGGGRITEYAETSSGVAIGILTSSTTAETVKIRAESGGKTNEVQVKYTPGSVSVSAVPSSMLGTGEEKAQITATIKNANGNPVSNETVKFTIDDQTLGTLSAGSALTNINGEAIVDFTAASKGGTVTITGLWTNSGTDITGTDTIDIQQPPSSIVVSNGYPNPASINVKGTGGQSTSQVIFDVKDSKGNFVVDGYKIIFSIESGLNGGEKVTPSSDLTSSGKVSVVLSSGSKSGPVSIKAAYYNNTNIAATTSSITINAGPPVGKEFTISPAYVNVSGIYIVNLENTININAGDAYSNAVPDNTAISFKTYNTGGLITPNSANTKDGKASSSLRSTQTDPIQGFLSVTSEANGGKTTHVTSLKILPYPDNNYVYAGTDGGGVYKSTDYGSSWTNISRSSDIQGQNWLEPYVNNIEVDPDNSNTVYAATGKLGGGHIYRSLDGGLNWNSANTEEWNGILNRGCAILKLLCDDGSSSYVWAGTNGDGFLYSSDGISFNTSATLSAGKTIKDIAKIPNTHGASAVLYAGTETGVYRSADGAQTWTKPSSFTGENINTVVLHPTSTGGATDIIYTGTEDAGVWVSLNSATSWSSYTSGMGKGLSATTPDADINNKGNGSISKVTVGSSTKTENWTITCKSEASDGGLFSVTGSVSGDQSDYDIKTGEYIISNILKFTITDGSTDFKKDDKFTFSTTRDPGRSIKSIVVDDTNNYLYAVTYFSGSKEPHPVGNVYSHKLNSDGSFTADNWVEANTNLPQYDPPDDATLFAQHVITIEKDSTGKVSSLLLGGEGINLYKATTGLSTGNPSWKESKSGLTNLIMARAPILFSGECTMTIYEERTGNNVTYRVYIQDKNGNPPISGSTFVAKTTTQTLRDITYGDVYRHQGTNPNSSTDDPYILSTTVTPGESQVTFTFTPTCQDTAPGCSGGKQERIFYY